MTQRRCEDGQRSSIAKATVLEYTMFVTARIARVKLDFGILSFLLAHPTVYVITMSQLLNSR